MLNKKIIVITPVYEEDEAASFLFRDIHKQFASDVFVLVVDDGSVRHPLCIENLRNAGVDGLILKLRRNVGHQRAIAIGMAFLSEHIRSEQRVVIMDSDGEDLPSTIPLILQQLESEETDIVVAKRRRRVETIKFILFYALYKVFFRIMCGRTINFGNYIALKPHALKRLAAMQESSVHIAGAVLASKLRLKSCTIDRGARYAGQSRMSFVGLVLHGLKGLMVFVEDVLVRVGVVCSVVAVFTIIGTLAAIALKLIGFSTPGWFSIAVGIMSLMLLQTGAVALITLLLSGIIRSGIVTGSQAHREFIECIISTDKSQQWSE